MITVSVARRARAARANVSSSAARVWITTRQAERARPARAAPRRRAAGRRAARSRGSSRGPSRRSRAPAGRRRRARSARCRRRRSPSASFGWRPTIANTSSCSCAAASARSIDALVHADGRDPADARRARPRDELARPAACSGRDGSGCRPRAPQAAGLGLDAREELAELAELRAAADGAEARARRASGPRARARRAAARPARA